MSLELLTEIQTLNLNEIKNLLYGMQRVTFTNFVKRQLPESVFSISSSNLIKYDGDLTQPILFIPSLINGPEILDISEKSSLMLELSSLGFTPFMIDWGTPGALESNYKIYDYVERILSFSEYIFKLHGMHKIAGYCMGGHLALAAGVQNKDYYKDVSVIATPWGFCKNYDVMRSRKFISLIEGMDDFISPTMLRNIFFSKDPFKVIEKYIKISAEMELEDEFLQIEYWATNPMPVAKGVFLEIVKSWVYDNALEKNRWYVNGKHIDLSKFDLPISIIAGKRDAIAAPFDCMRLFEQSKNANMRVIDTGHIGLVTSSKAVTAKMINAKL